MGGFFALVMLLPLLKGGQHIRIWAGAVALIFIVMALIRPAWLAPLNRIWQKIGLLLNRVVSPVMLAVVYFGTFVPLGYAMRLAGKDPLHRSWDKGATSYWISRVPPGPAPDSMRNQF